MAEQIRLMLNALERFLGRIIRTRFDEVVFVLVYILVLAGLCLVGFQAAGRAGLLLAGCFGLVPYAVCAVVLYRRPRLRNAKEVRRRLPGDCVGAGILFLAIYALGFFGASFYPSLHPVHGEMWLPLSLIGALAPGFVMAGLAGFVDPRVCVFIDPSTDEMPVPWPVRAVGQMLLWGGFLLGGGVMFLVHRAAA